MIPGQWLSVWGGGRHLTTENTRSACLDLHGGDSGGDISQNSLNYTLKMGSVRCVEMIPNYRVDFK